MAYIGLGECVGGVDTDTKNSCALLTYPYLAPQDVSTDMDSNAAQSPGFLSYMNAVGQFQTAAAEAKATSATKTSNTVLMAAVAVAALVLIGGRR